MDVGQLLAIFLQSFVVQFLIYTVSSNLCHYQWQNEMVEAAKKKEDDPNGGRETKPPIAPTKKVKSVVVGNLLGSNRKLETKKDVDTIVENIRKQLMDMLDDETILNLK